MDKSKKQSDIEGVPDTLRNGETDLELEDAIFGDVNEDGPNYRNVGIHFLTYTTCLLIMN